jgi:hypothetical protein
MILHLTKSEPAELLKIVVMVRDLGLEIVAFFLGWGARYLWLEIVALFLVEIIRDCGHFPG